MDTDAHAPVYTATSANGLEQANVRPYAGGRYAVTLVDVESGGTVPMAKIFRTLEDAKIYAEGCVAF
jgi:hypothetical protein